MNKSAVVLAADSAVTIGDGGNAKIYNTISKIFDASDQQPIAIMVFNSLNFMGMPIEVVIKEYRAKRSLKQYNSLREFKEDFLNFLSLGFQCSDKDKLRNSYLIISESLKIIEQEFRLELSDMLSSGKNFLPSKLNNIVQRILKREIDALKRLNSLMALVGKLLIRFTTQWLRHLRPEYYR